MFSSFFSFRIVSGFLNIIYCSSTLRVFINFFMELGRIKIL